MFLFINKDPLSHNKLRKVRKGSYLKSEVEKGMNKRLIVLTFCIVFVLVVAFQLKGKFNPPAEETFSKNEIRYGATGADVNELQGRLKFIGFMAAV